MEIMILGTRAHTHRSQVGFLSYIGEVISFQQNMELKEMGTFLMPWEKQRWMEKYILMCFAISLLMLLLPYERERVGVGEETFLMTRIMCRVVLASFKEYIQPKTGTNMCSKIIVDL
ncbi:hypothetical protein CXB49_00085 [Chromobacterium sp. ATCC 53434]|nr:hypothetical protein CXB49_00085 [Chromobacterium sp. ATCC 53434]